MKSTVFVLVLFFLQLSYGQVGIGTTNPQSTLDVNGNLSLKVVDVEGGNFANKANIDDGVYINLKPNNGAVNNGNDFELPDAALFPGRIYILRNVKDCDDAYIYSVSGSFFAGNSRTASTEPITMNADCATTGAVTKTLIFISDGINWTYGHLGF
ncbi:hypothetical protein [Pontimicrobium sp. IMCC45349]|uniref:hypothetical protein n=1 Tax=Pontimicrobium sp. IMCC45349 TaxID=3391574 RepID=UPI00399FCA26